jgi:hypothetical protein
MSQCEGHGDRVSGDTFRYENAELGLRFEIDARFQPGPRLQLPADSPHLGRVRSAYLAAHGASGGQAVFSIAWVEVGYDMSPQELAEQMIIHNRYAALTAEQQGWTIHRPWQATTVGGHLAMRNDYVAPASSLGPDDDAASGQAGERATDPAGGNGQSESAPGHVQGYVVYVARRTYQIMLGVHPPGNLDSNRSVMEHAMGSIEFFEPAES